MKLVIVSVLDSVSGLFGRPAFVASKGAALRSFSDEVNRKDDSNDLYKHPGDFQLLYLGTFDDQTGEFSDLCQQRLILGSEVTHVQE